MSDNIDQTPAPPADDRLLSIREAARQLSQWGQQKRQQTQQEGAPSPEAEATPEQDSAPEADTAPQEEPLEPSGETPEELEPEGEEAPQPIEPPGSWTAEEKERFAQLPRETQEYLATREQQRDAELRRRQNEVAEWLQRLAPEQQALMQARAQYEQALPAVYQALQSTGEFADIQTYDDVEKLAKEDWPRFNQYQAHMMKVQAVQQELTAAQQRQMQEHLGMWQNYAADQDRRFAEAVPEFADPAKAKQLQELAIQTLENDYGFSLQEMQAGWAGAFRDHRVQQILLDATRYRQLKKNPPKPADRSLPPVQRPGVAGSSGNVRTAGVKALEQKLDQTGNLRDAAKLLSARRAARR